MAESERYKDIRILLEAALSAHRFEYEELSRVFRDLDSKAQGAVAIAGIFVAATFAFVRQDPKLMPAHLTGGLGVAVGLLLLAVVSAILVLKVRTLTGAPGSQEISDLVDDLIAPGENGEKAKFEERVRSFYRDQIHLWQAPIVDLRMADRTKAGYLLSAQIMLALAIASVGFLIFMILV